MCGVCGFWGPADRALLDAMTAAQVHRGRPWSMLSDHLAVSAEIERD